MQTPTWVSRILLWALLLGSVLSVFGAFRAILIAPFSIADPDKFEYWFFIPNRDSGAISVLIACWLLWNRRADLRGTGSAAVSPRHAAIAIAILAPYCWAIWVSAQALLIPILCATIAALAATWGGRSALRSMVMPCAALMLAFPPPSPLQAEIIWRLQQSTAAGAHLVLTLLGYSPQLEGTQLLLGGYAFIIIEACSGWRGIQILALVGLAAAELNGLRFRRAILVVLAAIPLGILLNIVRACIVMLTQEELKAEFFESHTPQGIAVLLVGAVVLYAIATATRGRRGEGKAPPVLADAARNGVSSTSVFLRAAMFLALSFALLTASYVVPILRGPVTPQPPPGVEFPTAVGAWNGTVLPLDYFFPYSTPANPQFHAEYKNPQAAGGGEVVDLFIAWETPKPSGLDRMPDSKLLLPSNDWTIVSRAPVRVWQFAIDAEEAVVSREGSTKFSHVVAWRTRDRGLLIESLQSLLGIRGCRDDTGLCTRLVVRIAVPIFHDDDKGRARARRTVDRFIDALILPLKVLAIK